LGIDIVDPDGNEISDDTIKFFLRAAQREIENYLEVKMMKQIIRENKDYDKESFHNWGYIQTTYPVVDAISLAGEFTSVEQIKYPATWLRERNTNAGQQDLIRRINLMPFTGETASINAVFVGAFPHLPLFGAATGSVPEYWVVEYCTGWAKKKLPEDILSVLGKMASIPIFNMLGDIILARAGIGSQSIGIDGLSQSINTTSGVENAGYGARITQYKKELEVEIPRLRGNYNSDVQMVSM